MFHPGPQRLAYVVEIIFVFVLSGQLQGALAQNPVVTAPGALQPQQDVRAAATAGVSGIIRDAYGNAVPEVRVSIVRQNESIVGVGKADNKGNFTFTGLTPDTYRIKIDKPGLKPFASAEVVLGAGDKPELLIVAQLLPKTITTVNVSATLTEIAQEQVKEEEKQRIFGFLPNFYTSYLWNAAPMSPQLKLQMATRSVIDPASLLIVAGLAGVEQAHKTFPAYGQGAQGYGKRLGGAYADTVSARMFSSALYPMLFHQDPRYYYRGSGSVHSRIAHALASTFICRGDNGQLEPNYSQVLGSFTAAGLSNVYKSPQDRQASTTFRNGLIITAGSAAINLLREFVSRQLTPSVPKFANGKP